MNKKPNIPPPHNANDLKKMLHDYGNILTPQNRNLIQQIINELENGNTNSEKMKQISSQMQKNAQSAKSEMEKTRTKAASQSGQKSNINNASKGSQDSNMKTSTKSSQNIKKSESNSNQRTQTTIQGSRKKPK